MKFSDESQSQDDIASLRNEDVFDAENQRMHFLNENTPLLENNVKEDPKEEQAPYNGGCNFFCNPQSSCHKAIALLLICSIGFGNYFCYDNPGALQHPIQKVMNVTTLEFENLYAYYSWPNVILPIVGGYLIDKVLGIPFGTIVFASFICLGQALTAVGAFTDSFLLMKISRIIYGIGGETLAVSGNTYVSVWFKGRGLNAAMGFQLSFARVGSYANFLSTGRLFSYVKDKLGYIGTDALGWTLVLVGASTVLSLFTSIVMGILEKRRSRLLNEDMEKQEKIRLQDVRKFSSSFWIITAICVMYYVSVFPFISVAQVFLHETFEFDDKTATSVQGLPYLISAFAVPIFGMIIDRLGRNIIFATIACAVTLVSHLLFLFGKTQALAYCGIIVMGGGYSLLAASLWPMISLTTPLSRQGTAFGITQAIQNLGLGLGAKLVGYITDNFDYFWVEIFFVLSLAIAILACLALAMLNHKGNKYLLMKISDRKKFEVTEEYKVMMDIETRTATQKHDETSS